MLNGADAMALVELLDALPPAARVELLRRYCPDCGEIVPEEEWPCQCRNDE